MKILVTGGTGYIGSHIAVELLQRQMEVVIVDNLSNSSFEVCGAITRITHKPFTFYKYDVLDEEKMRMVFEAHKIDAVIHCAAFKAVGESVEKPIAYYINNLMSTLVIAKLMKAYHVPQIIFSSSATVYGDPETVPLTEDAKLGETTNPYGASKAMMERILIDVQKANPKMSVTLLRYFNPIGAHPSGEIGEDPQGLPNNLMPYIMKVAAGELPYLRIFGDDYETKDGTGIRDYIHVVDLAIGHVLALKAYREPGVHITNLGTGQGYSVMEIVQAFVRVNHVKVPYKIVERRPGDIAVCYADPSKAKKELQWVAERGIEDMCRDAWHFVETRRK